jgi:hypothetical protein
MKRSQPRRSWTAADAKIKGKPCRNCGSWQNVQHAHLVPRRYDPKAVGPRGGKFLVVPAAAIMELCGGCHFRVDAHALAVWHLMTDEERQHATNVLGEERARDRLERIDGDV